MSEALAIIEIDGISRALLAQDAVLKRADVTILACAPVTPGKTLLIFQGDVANTQESLQAGLDVAASRIIDHAFLPGIHPAVVAAMTGEGQDLPADEALAIVECVTVAATILAADAALKAAAVSLGRLHLACGFAGKGYFTLHGPQGDLEAAVEACMGATRDESIDAEIIPAPHPDLSRQALTRPWCLDPTSSAPP